LYILETLYVLEGLSEKNLAVWKGNPAVIEEQGFKKKHSQEMNAILENYKIARIELKSRINDTVDFQGIDELRSELMSSILTDLREDAGGI
jgi:selenocysteine-specific translation elongation factor